MAIAAIAAPACVQRSKHNASTCYFPIEHNKRWGVIDQFGNIIVEPTFRDVARTNLNNFAPKHVGSEAVLLIGETDWRCVTREGIRRIAPPVARGSSFLVENLGESMFAVYTEAEINVPPARTSRVIDPSDKWSPPEGTRVYYGFAEGFIAIERGGRFGFADRLGRIVIPPRYDEVGKFAEGLAPVMKGHKWGYLNRDGSLAITPQFDVATEFNAGHARVLVNSQKAALINTAGQVVREWPFRKPSFVESRFPRGFRWRRMRKLGYADI